MKSIDLATYVVKFPVILKIATTMEIHRFVTRSKVLFLTLKSVVFNTGRQSVVFNTENVSERNRIYQCTKNYCNLC